MGVFTLELGMSYAPECCENCYVLEEGDNTCRAYVTLCWDHGRRTDCRVCDLEERKMASTCVCKICGEHVGHLTSSIVGGGYVLND